jgi:hypothetical protein
MSSATPTWRVSFALAVMMRTVASHAPGTPPVGRDNPPVKPAG